MRISKIKGLLILFTILSCACKKVISVNLNDTSPQIVIEGNITSNTGTYLVQIFKTVNFSATNTFPTVSGAMVKITDSTTGTTDLLTEATPGNYMGNTLQGVPGHTYSLYVVAEGQTYTASSIMPVSVPLDSVTFQHNNRFGTTDINPVANFQDPTGITNYYTFTQTVNGKKLKNTFVFDDRLSDGKYIRQQIFSDSTNINIGDTVSLQMNCIDLGAFNFYNTVDRVTGGNNFNSVSPSNPLSNITNNALGYFSAHTAQIETAIAQ